MGESRALLVLKAFLWLRMSPTLTSRTESMGWWGKTQREQFEERPGMASPQAALWECLECLKGSQKGCLMSLVTSPLLSWALGAAMTLGTSTWREGGHLTLGSVCPRGTQDSRTLLGLIRSAPLQDRPPCHQISLVREGVYFQSPWKVKCGAVGFENKKFLGNAFKKQDFIYCFGSIGWFSLFGGQLSNMSAAVKYVYSWTQ